jgi:alkylated DNA repair dioxygenase AlkB
MLVHIRVYSVELIFVIIGWQFSPVARKLAIIDRIAGMPHDASKRKSPLKRRRTGPVPAQNAGAGTLVLPNASGFVTYVPQFLRAADADALFERTESASAWERTPIRFFGKEVLQPRDTAFFGTEEYSYSDCAISKPISWDADPVAMALYKVKLSIEKLLYLPPDFFNVALCNKYNSGADYMGFHADDEKTMGPTPVIASVSLGAERRFLLREKKEIDGNRRRIEYTLEHGSLLVMSGETQMHWKHSLPKQAGIGAQRLNFTFRRVVSDDDLVCPDSFWRPSSMSAQKAEGK